MQTQDKEAIQGTQTAQKSRRVPWLTGLGILIVTTLLVSLGATVFAYTRTLHTSTMTAKSITWQRVLNGYSILSLTAAPSNPAVLYACGTPFHASTRVPYRPSQPLLSYTLLRSGDSGTTWQEVSQLGADCQLAINQVKSDDLYVIGLAGHVASNGEVPSVLRHSIDGGRSWTDIAPTLNTGNPQLSVVWHVQQLTMVGNHLFGLQVLPTARVQPIVRPSPIAIATRLDLTRLVESSDDGHTWSIVDSNLNMTGQGSYGYVVSPSDSQTIYELVGSGEFPSGTPITPKNITPKNMPSYAGSLSLYKTTNSGGTWTKLRENIQYGSQIQIASNNPSLVFMSGSAGVLSPTGPVVSPLPAYFSLAVSKDGGASWSTIKQPASDALVQNWFISADGQVYATTGTIVNGQPTGTIGTLVPVGTNQIKPVGNSVTITQKAPEGTVTAIQRYDVISNTWSTVTKTPSSGMLLAVTTSATTHAATLWFLSDATNAQELYRETL